MRFDNSPRFFNCHLEVKKKGFDLTMRSLITNWFLNLKLETTLEEAIRLKTHVLDLRHHGLEECPNVLKTLPSEYTRALKCLLLQANLLGCFPRVNCHCLETLKGLTLDYNRLLDIPFDFRHLRNLTVLNVSHNNFQSLHFLHVICQLKNLRILWANATGITEIPVEIAELTNLRILGLRRNQIKILPIELLSLGSLRWLTLASNHIVEIPSEISNFSRLVHLNLQRNFIERLPETFKQLQELQYLFLDYNLLIVDSNFKSFVSSLPSLKYCSVSRNVCVSDATSPNSQESGNENIIVGSSSTSLLLRPRRADNNNNLVEAIRPADAVDPLENWRLSLGHDVSSPESVATNENGESGEERGDVRQSRNEDASAELTGSGSTIFCISQDEDEDKEKSDGQVTKLSKQIDDSNQPLEVIFTWNAPEGNSELAAAEFHGANGDIISTDFENVQPTAPLALCNPSVGEDIHFSVGASVTNVLLDDDKNVNGNVDKRITEENSIQDRTEMWILQNQHAERIQENKNSSIFSMKSSEERLCKRVKNTVSILLENAAQQARRNVTEGAVMPTISSASLIYLMPHGREPQPYSLNASASFVCNRAASSTTLVAPSSNANRLPVYHTETGSFENLDDSSSVLESVSFNPSGSFTDMGNTSTFTLSNLEINDTESNYDPSDWEHSAPSSAIDDQDIIMRFPEFRDEGMEAEDVNNFALLNEQDWKRIIPLALIR